MNVVSGALLVLLVLSFPYIDLAVDVTLLGRQIDTPIADLAAAALLFVVAAGVLLGAGLRPATPREGGGPPSTPLGAAIGALRAPGWRGYGLLVAAGLAGLAFVPEPGASAWFLVRKPIFLYLAYGVAVATVATRAPTSLVRGALRASIVLVATVSLASSVGRIAAGDALWFTAIEGLTNNHKTLAVALAPLVPLLLGMRRGRLDLGIVALALVAIAASMSRTAWIATAAGLAFFVVWRGRRLAARRGLVVGIVIVGMLAALYGPVLIGSRAQLDAARSRHSLDKRALEMVAAWPALGMGGGANVRYELQTFPHYRVNGVDAHGTIQKVASEYGLVGLAGWLAFVGAVGARLARRAPVGARLPDGLAPAHLAVGLWATFVALHVNLLLSTETFSQTHWAPLALVWGLSRRRA